MYQMIIKCIKYVKNIIKLVISVCTSLFNITMKWSGIKTGSINLHLVLDHDPLRLLALIGAGVDHVQMFAHPQNVLGMFE